MSYDRYDAGTAKQALLRRLGAAPWRAGGPELRRAWLRWAAAGAGAMLAGGFLSGAFVAARYEGRLGRIHRETAALRDEIQREESSLRQRAVLYQSVVELLRDSATRLVTLRGAGPTPGAQGRIVWHDRVGGILFLTKLPPAPEDKLYSLWAISAGRPRPAGLFQADQAGEATQRLAPVGRPVEAFTVTLEPMGGVPAPTGRVVLASGESRPDGAGRLGGALVGPPGQAGEGRESASEQAQHEQAQHEQAAGEGAAGDDRPVPPRDEQ
jgi:hypothetical protein